MFDDLLDGVGLLFGRVAVFGQEALDDGAELGLDVVAGGPVGGQVAADGLDEVAGDAGDVEPGR